MQTKAKENQVMAALETPKAKEAQYQLEAVTAHMHHNDTTASRFYRAQTANMSKSAESVVNNILKSSKRKPKDDKSNKSHSVGSNKTSSTEQISNTPSTSARNVEESSRSHNQTLTKRKRTKNFDEIWDDEDLEDFKRPKSARGAKQIENQFSQESKEKRFQEIEKEINKAQQANDASMGILSTCSS